MSNQVKCPKCGKEQRIQRNTAKCRGKECDQRLHHKTHRWDDSCKELAKLMKTEHVKAETAKKAKELQISFC